MIEFLVVLAILLAVGIGIKLNFKIYHLKPFIILLLLFALTGIPDVVITSHYAYLQPEKEGNPLAAYFLSFEYGIALAAFLWAFGWILLSEAFIRLKLYPLAYFTLLTLFAAHLLGTLTWADNIKTEDIRFLSWSIALGYTVLFWAGLQLWKTAKSSVAPERNPGKRKKH